MSERFFDLQRFATIYIDSDDTVFIGTNSRDSIYNTGDNVTISCGAGNDSIYNSGSNVTIEGGKGNDSIKINGTNVLLKYTEGDGNDLIQGFNSTLTLQIGSGKGTYSSTKSGDDVIITVGTGKITLAGAATIPAGYIEGKKSSGSTDSIKTITNKTKSPVTVGSSIKTITAATRTKAVQITGNKLANSIVGGTKNDTIYGGAGNDIINGGAGNDKLYGEAGNDTLRGGSGNDTLTGGKGNDLFICGAGNDVITDYATGDKISLGAAITNATVSGSNVILTIGNSKLTVKNAKQKTLTLIDAAGNENQTVIGSAMLTLTNSSKANVTLSSAYANASASKRTKAIRITGNALDNSIIGGTKNDILQGGAGNDTLRGGNGNDKLSGDKGNDYLNGGKGNDLIQGGAGNDTLYGGAGNDTLQGGSGSNVFIYNDGDGKDIIVDYKAEDIINIATGIVDSIYRSGDNVVFKVGAGSITVKDAKNQVVTYSEGGEEKQYFPVSSYFLNFKNTNVTLSSSYTTYYGKTFDANAQNDTKNVIGINAANVDDDLVIKGNAKNNLIYGSNGDNTIYGGKGNDTIYGGDGSNLYVYNSGDGNDLICNWDDSDTVSIASGWVSGITVKNDTAILTIGKGKVSLRGIKANTEIAYRDEDGWHNTIVSANDNVLEGDNFITGNNLSAIVADKAVDYAFAQAGNVTALTKSNNALPALSPSKKK